MILPQVIASRGLNFSLHGAWGDEVDVSDSLSQVIPIHNITYDEFVKTFQPLKNYIDASPRSNFTCCHGQYHEYIIHGCHQGHSYDEWYKAVVSCIQTYNVTDLYPHQCRYDGSIDANIVETGSSVNLGSVGFVEGKDFIFKKYDECVKLGLIVKRVVEELRLAMVDTIRVMIHDLSIHAIEELKSSLWFM